MKRVIFFLLCIVILGTLFYCRTQSVSIDVSNVERQINYIKFKDFTLNLDLILGTGKDKNNKFKSPYSMTVDSAGNIYIADTGNKRIQVFSSIGEYIETIGGKDKEKIKLSSPLSLSLDDKNLYIADFTRARKKIHILSKEGKLIHTFRIPLIAIEIAVKEDFIYICDKSTFQESSLYKYSKNGDIITHFEKGEGKENINRSGIFSMDGEGNLYFAYRFLPKVKKYTSRGKFLMEFGYEPSIKNKKDPITFIPMPTERISGRYFRYSGEARDNPVCYDIAVDIYGMIYLLVAADHEKNEKCTLYRFDPSGNLLEKAALPILCGRIHIDSFSNFYFLSPNATYLLLRYKTPLAFKNKHT